MPVVARGETIKIYAKQSDESEVYTGTDKTIDIFPPGNSQFETMHLLLKAQLLIYRRYESAMACHKYPTYAILLKCVTLPVDQVSLSNDTNLLQSQIVSSDRAEFLQTATDLIFRTCLISPLNSKELVLESGIQILASLLHFFVKIARAMKAASVNSVVDATDNNIASIDVVVGIISNTVRTIAGVAYFEYGRIAIKELIDLDSFLINWRRCSDGSILDCDEGRVVDSAMKRFSLEGIANMAKESVLQIRLISCGVVWPLLRLMLLYDPTLNNPTESSEDCDDTYTSVAVMNDCARHAVRALGMLSGALENAPKNYLLAHALNQLLTASIAILLRNKRTGTILHILNSNVERPDILWNNQMRMQLEDLLTKIGKERREDCSQEIQDELYPVEQFKYDSLKNETRIGNIYIRLFTTEGKESLNRVANPMEFADAVVKFIARSLDTRELKRDLAFIPLSDSTEIDATACSYPDDSPSGSIDSNSFLLCLQAFRILCQDSGLVQDLVERPHSIITSVILSLLELPIELEVRTLAVSFHFVT
jgi:hypothetical protein